MKNVRPSNVLRTIVAVLFVASCIIDAFGQKKGVIEGAGCLRKDPSYSSKVIIFFKEGDTVQIAGTIDEFHGVTYGKLRGFVATHFVRIIQPPARAVAAEPDVQITQQIAPKSKDDSLYAELYVASSAGVPIWKTPDGAQLGRAKSTEKVLLYGYKGGYYYRIIYRGKVGYIYASFLEFNKHAVDTMNAYNQKHDRSFRKFEYKPLPKNNNSTAATNVTSSKNDSIPSNVASPRKTESRVYHVGPRGGVYYINSKGNKVYKKK